ncbi:hypothetical protein [Legionella maioricensis]|uniref:Uncharacterized protein n=1 Tax=Legionella maioricensis TaxID=2896528 RepID=A0A9X2ICH5_9GAMM|nr:hypothetical protein [Legionella maioricensis]MCL9684427.1 hypothetical protein [Legionella maioricensis]MCL9687608.1 hypothetical protein [Legionella maioricensis]
MLAPPTSQAPECNYSYNNAAQPKTAEDILAAMQPICTERGGLRVLNKLFTSGNSKEPINLILTCIGDNPNQVIFHCLFSTSYENL